MLDEGWTKMNYTISDKNKFHFRLFDNIFKISANSSNIIIL
jgi:hypothetical protein